MLLDIPVISLIDALISNGYEYDNGYRYTMWFPGLKNKALLRHVESGAISRPPRTEKSISC